MPPPNIRIVLADDHHLLREGFKTLLHKKTPYTIVGEASNGIELIEKVKELSPDMVITDIMMPKMNGIEATKILTAQFPHIPVLAFSMLDSESSVTEMLESGAKGYLVKACGKEEIVDAIEAVCSNQAYYCNATTRSLITGMASSRYDPFKKDALVELTDQEKKIIQLICKDKSTKEIATALNVSVRTIDAHRRNIIQKIGVASPIGIMIFALKNGIIPIQEFI